MPERKAANSVRLFGNTFSLNVVTSACKTQTMRDLAEEVQLKYSADRRCGKGKSRAALVSEGSEQIPQRAAEEGLAYSRYWAIRLKGHSAELSEPMAS
eukprot:IDg2354t1